MDWIRILDPFNCGGDFACHVVTYGLAGGWFYYGCLVGGVFLSVQFAGKLIYWCIKREWPLWD